VASTTSTRIWRTCKAANRPFPTLVEDDVLDYMIVEAVGIKVAREDREAQDEAEKQARMKALKDEAKEQLKHLFPSHGR